MVCGGSSCLGRCRGSFNPVKSFKGLEKTQGGSVEVHEVECLNMCKRGPNVRMMYGKDSVTVDGVMNDVERRRKAFQGVASNERVASLWDIAKAVHDGTAEFEVHGLPE
eukprot:jgi/Bigna1/139988/aug1.53_g14696